MRRDCGGFTLVEVMVAVLLLSMIALALSTTLVSAQRARAVSERWMHAVQLATAGMERLRAGQALAPDAPGSGFECSSVVTPWAGHPRILRVEVMVRWSDGGPRLFRLTSLVAR